mmetsp:Transcript_85971/g.135745  ORF Transcript_85971/g.135745 Transcript_85971/m.135745 type:complete len:229 (+) Transcript_85971:45-731(+)
MAMIASRLLGSVAGGFPNEPYLDASEPKDSSKWNAAGWTGALVDALAGTRGVLVFKRSPEVRKALAAVQADQPKPKKVLRKDRSAFKKLEPYSPPQMMMPMMPMGAMPQMPMPAKMPKQVQAAPQEVAAGGQKAPVAIKREGGALTVLNDKSVIEAKIKDIAVQIIGDDEGVDADIPLMQAGLTSNTAVMLRDELSKDIPGVNLPPTLMFDYPSIAAIAEFIVEKANS